MDGWPVSEGSVSETNHDCKGRSSLRFRYFNFKMNHEVFGLFIGTGTWSQAKGQLILIQHTCVRLETRTDEGRGEGDPGGSLFSCCTQGSGEAAQPVQCSSRGGCPAPPGKVCNPDTQQDGQDSKAILNYT